MADTSFFDSAEDYRDFTRAATTPADISQVWPDQWVDWGGVTVTLDPIGTKQWVHDSHDGHARSERRALQYDKERVRNLLDWEKSASVDPIQYYHPSLDKTQQFNPVMGDQTWGCRSYRGVMRDKSRWGLLPSITARIHEGSLPDKDRGQIEAEIREQNRRRATRLYDHDEMMPVQTPADVVFMSREEQEARKQGKRMSDFDHVSLGNISPAITWNPNMPDQYVPVGPVMIDGGDWRGEASMRHNNLNQM